MGEFEGANLSDLEKENVNARTTLYWPGEQNRARS